jgi:hypothetical protein
LNLQLVSSGDHKIQVIKAVREVTGWGLKEAKEWVDNAPSSAIDVAPEQADAIAAALRNAGATVEVANTGYSGSAGPAATAGSGASPGAGSGAGPGSSVADELEKLSSLHDQGALTDAEFAAAKARLLGLP